MSINANQKSLQTVIAVHKLVNDDFAIVPKGSFKEGVNMIYTMLFVNHFDVSPHVLSGYHSWIMNKGCIRI